MRWLVKRYGDDFEPNFLNHLVISYSNSIDKHTEYSKKRTIKYIADNFFKLDRIYRKQESLYWIKRGWSKKMAEKKRIIRNKEWYLDTYGPTEGLIKFNNKNLNISKNSGHSIDKFIKRYGEMEGKINFEEYKKNCKRNLDFFVKKYGEIEGKNKYKDFKKHIGKASKESLLIFNPLINWLKDYVDISDIYYGDKNSREFFIVEKGKVYLYDFTIKSLKIIIEYNGHMFHVNENWSEAKKIKWKHPFKSMSYQESIANDNFKKSLALKNEFKILTIWSDTPVEENISICIEFIKNNLVI